MEQKAENEKKGFSFPIPNGLLLVILGLSVAIVAFYGLSSSIVLFFVK